MTVLKKAEFEKEIEKAIAEKTKLRAEVQAVSQEVPYDHSSPTIVKLRLLVWINGEVEDLERR